MILRGRRSGIRDRAKGAAARAAPVRGVAIVADAGVRSASECFQRAAEAARQPAKIRNRLLERPAAERFEAIELLAAPAALGRRVAEARGHIALVLEPAERLVDRAERDFP